MGADVDQQVSRTRRGIDLTSNCRLPVASGEIGYQAGVTGSEVQLEVSDLRVS